MLDENNRKSGVRFSTFRKKLNIYSYVPGESDHHQCMMQNTISGELTRLLRTNSSVGSYEQEVKFFRLKWTKRGHYGKEFDRIAKSYPWLAKKALVGGPKKVKPKPFVYKIQHSRSLRYFPFRRVINKHVKVVQRFLGRACKPIVARTVAPNLFLSNVQCRVAARQTDESRLKVCFIFVFGCVLSQKLIRCTTLSSVVTSICPKIFALEELSFNERRREEFPSSFDACHLHGSLSVSYFLVESADQIRHASQRTDRLPVSGSQFNSEPYSAMNPRYQDGNFQTAADMLRNQQREFVEPLMQQVAADLGDTLAVSISFAVGQQFRPHRTVT